METARGPGRCKIDNGGCWQESQGSVTYSACQVSLLCGLTFYLTSYCKDFVSSPSSSLVARCFFYTLLHLYHLHVTAIE
jgi:hypothetical protein